MRTLSANCTGWRECRRQYSASSGVSAVAPNRCGCRPAATSGRRTAIVLRTTRTRRAPVPAVPSGRRGWSPATCSGPPRRRAWRRSVPGRRPDPTARCWGRCTAPTDTRGNSLATSSTCLASANTATIRPPVGQAAEQPAALGHQPGAVLEAEDSGHARRRILADAVPEHHVGLDAPRLPQPGQTHLDGEERRLSKRRVPQRFPLAPVSRSVANSTSSNGRGSMSSTASAQRLTVSAKTGSESNNSRAIPGYWLPCPVNNHAVVGWSVCSPRTTPGRSRFSARSASSLARAFDRIHHQRGAVFEVRTAGSGRAAYVGEVDVGWRSTRSP